MEPQDSILEDIEETPTELPRARRIAAGIIDGVVEVVLILSFYWIIPTQWLEFLAQYKPVSSYVVVFLWFTLYRLFTILLLQRTIGMILCRCKYLNEKLQPLSLKEKLIATIVNKSSKIKLYKA
jgi:uncharacterized RDD family membrane protein YckC